ncbi:MAG: hypothetical protein K2K97_06490 [Muribaculaceae bacterium]|nr:hypothetical protein [Muribaculaceae bacterium]
MTIPKTPQKENKNKGNNKNKGLTRIPLLRHCLFSAKETIYCFALVTFVPLVLINRLLDLQEQEKQCPILLLGNYEDNHKRKYNLGS